MRTTVLANVNQVTPVIASGNDVELTQDKLGNLHTKDLVNRLIDMGLVYAAHIGTLSAGADVGFITGGGNGTTVDSDQPELIVSVPTGYFLIPIRVRVSCVLDVDANAEYGEIVLFADRTQAYTTCTGTPGTVTPNNLLDGHAGSWPGYVGGGVTTDITDPVMSEFLDIEYVNTAEFVSNGSATNLTNGLVYKLRMDYHPDYLEKLAGPCTLVCCFGGTAAVTGMINAVFACVPSSYYPLT